jgi:hypothetical protein
MHRGVVAESEARAAGIRAVVSKAEGVNTLINHARLLMAS